MVYVHLYRVVLYICLFISHMYFYTIFHTVQCWWWLMYSCTGIYCTFVCLLAICTYSAPWVVIIPFFLELIYISSEQYSFQDASVCETASFYFWMEIQKLSFVDLASCSCPWIMAKRFLLIYWSCSSLILKPMKISVLNKEKTLFSAGF